MRKTLKRLLCTAIATVAAVGALMTVNVFADTTTANWKFGSGTGCLNQGYSKGNKGSIESDISGINIYVDATNEKFTVNNASYNQFNAGAKIYVPAYAEGDTITITGYSGTAENSYNVVGADTSKMVQSGTTNNAEYQVSAADVTNFGDGTDLTKGICITATTNTYLKQITLVTSNAPTVTETKIKPTINVTGYKSNDTNLEITLTSNTSTAYTLEQLTAGDVELTVGKTYSVSAKGSYVYTADSFTIDSADTKSVNITLNPITPVTVSDDGGFTFNGKDSCMEKWTANSGLYRKTNVEFTDTDSGVKFLAGSISDWYSSAGPKTTGNLVSFNAKKGGKLTFTVNVSNINNVSAETIKLAVAVNGTEKASFEKDKAAGEYKVEVAVQKDDEIKVTLTNQSFYSDFSASYGDILAEGTVNATATTPVAVKSTGDNLYVIVVIPQAKATSANSLTVDGKAVGTVYQKVSINNTEYDASEFGGAATDYVYGYKVNITKGLPSDLAAVQTKAAAKVVLS